MSMTPDALSEQLQAACGASLRSILLFGSAAAGDHLGKRSDYNVLIVLDRLDADVLKTMAPLARRWVRCGNPSPLLFTTQHLARAAGVFPLEMADLKESHRVLAGEDVTRTLSIDTSHVRYQLAHELEGKLMQLRARYLLVHGKPRQVTELLVRSLSTFLVLCRGALRLYQPQVPAKKLDALAELAKHVSIQTRVFETIAHMKAGRAVAGVVPDALFDEYVRMIEVLIDVVEARSHPHQSAEEGRK